MRRGEKVRCRGIQPFPRLDSAQEVIAGLRTARNQVQYGVEIPGFRHDVSLDHAVIDSGDQEQPEDITNGLDDRLTHEFMDVLTTMGTPLVKAFADASEKDPLSLSNARAEAVADWLTARGVSRDRVEPRGCGTTRPLWTDETLEHRAANRRVEIVTQTPAAGCEPPRSFDDAVMPP